MKIYGIGDYRTTALQFSQFKADDDWVTTRPQITANVGGSDGAFDFHGTSNYPIAPLTVGKSFTIPAHLCVVGTGTVSTTSGDATITGSSTNFSTFLKVGRQVFICESLFTVASITDDTHFEATEAATESVSGARYYFIDSSDSNYASLDNIIDILRLMTIAHDETKLWAQMRDGTFVWTYAKCVSFSASEKQDTRMELPVSLEFFCRTGLWYGETARTITSGGGGASAVNAGNFPATVYIDVTVGASNMTVFSAQISSSNYVSFTGGTIAANKHLIIDTEKSSAKNDGTGCYANISLGLGVPKYETWLYIPASSTVTLSTGATGGGTYSAYYRWYDTYLL